jgi:hypothetical protein
MGLKMETFPDIATFLKNPVLGRTPGIEKLIKFHH